jgi:chemotaxis protein MotB
MGRFLRYWKLLVVVGVAISIQGCAELNEIKNLNRRQAITIRDQAAEIERVRGELDNCRSKLASSEKISMLYGDKAKVAEEEKARLRAELEKLAKTIGEGAAVRETPEGPVIQLPEKILFDSGKAVIKPKGEDALQKIAEYLKSKSSEQLRIDGHTDSDPIKKSAFLWDSNHHLSSGRALSVFHFLTKKQGIEEGKIYVSGFGPNRPVADNHTTDGKRKNRRVEFLILTATEGGSP